MPNFTALEFASHRLLRIATVHGVAQGDGLGMVGVVPAEIPALVNSYPLFFRTSPVSGTYELSAMLGFADDENLFLTGQGWDAGYVPLTVRREPFAVQRSAATPDRNTLMIDLDSPRLTTTGGDVLFFSDGRPSERLQAIIDALEALVTGAEVARDYVAALISLDLIEPVDLRIDLGNGVAPALTGLHAIAQDRLGDLPATTLRDLQQRGFLPWIYQQAASVGQVSNLIVRKQRAMHSGGRA